MPQKEHIAIIGAGVAIGVLVLLLRARKPHDWEPGIEEMWLLTTCASSQCGEDFEYEIHPDQSPYIPVKCPYCNLTQATLPHSTGRVRKIE